MNRNPTLTGLLLLRSYGKLALRRAGSSVLIVIGVGQSRTIAYEIQTMLNDRKYLYICPCTVKLKCLSQQKLFKKVLVKSLEMYL